MIKAILFDLDGTLIDSTDLIMHSFNYVLKEHLNLEVPEDEIRSLFGRPLFDQMALYGGKERAQELVDKYIEHNLKSHKDYLKEIPGVKETLQGLKEKGYILGVVTSKREESARLGMQICGIEEFFEVFVFSNTVKIHKPEPEPVLHALRVLGLKPEEAVYVGDSVYDIICGQRAGVETVAVGYTPGGRERLRATNPDHWIEKIEELLEIY